MVHDKEKNIFDLKKENQELEKYKYVLDYKIKELKTQIEPREHEIDEISEKIIVIKKLYIKYYEKLMKLLLLILPFIF